MLDRIAGHFNATFQPGLPADIAAWNKSMPSVYDDKLRVHDAEGEEEEALDMKVNVGSFEKLRVRKAKVFLP